MKIVHVCDTSARFYRALRRTGADNHNILADIFEVPDRVAPLKALETLAHKKASQIQQAVYATGQCGETRRAEVYASAFRAEVNVILLTAASMGMIWREIEDCENDLELELKRPPARFRFGINHLPTGPVVICQDEKSPCVGMNAETKENDNVKNKQRNH